MIDKRDSSHNNAKNNNARIIPRGQSQNKYDNNKGDDLLVVQDVVLGSDEEVGGRRHLRIKHSGNDDIIRAQQEVSL